MGVIKDVRLIGGPLNRGFTVVMRETSGFGTNLAGKS